MKSRTYLIIAIILIHIATAINYSMVEDFGSGTRSHSDGGTIFIPSGGSGWHK